MENITLGNISHTLGFIATLIGSITVITKVLSGKIKKQVNEVLTSAIKESVLPMKEEIKNIKEEITELKEEIKGEVKDLTLEQCKNYLVRFINDINTGEKVSIAEIQRYYEARDRYYDKGGNSYIHSECEAIEPMVRDIIKNLEKRS